MPRFTLLLVFLFTATARAQSPAEVENLINQLGAEKFAEREKAFRALKKIGKPAFAALQIAEKSPNLEIAVRARKLAAPFHEERHAKLASEIMPTSWPRVPWVCIGSYYGGESSVWVAKAREGGAKDGAPDWPAWREGTRLLVLDLLRGGKTEQEVRLILDDMARCERAWIEANGAHYTPPIELPFSKEF